MTSGDFQHQNAERWAEYERLIGKVEAGDAVSGADELPRRFRELCVDLSLAESRMYGLALTERLNALVIRGYEVIYRTRRGGWEDVIRFLAVKFPQTVRREWRLFWLCSAVFWLPFLALMLSPGHDIRWVQAVLGSDGWREWSKCMAEKSNRSRI